MSTKQLWDACRHLRCGNCGAAPTAYCVLKVGDKEFARHLPCLTRLKEAGL